MGGNIDSLTALIANESLNELLPVPAPFPFPGAVFGLALLPLLLADEAGDEGAEGVGGNAPCGAGL